MRSFFKKKEKQRVIKEGNEKKENPDGPQCKGWG
jgi:hypothetical protein